jgi:hypothetical protein
MAQTVELLPTKLKALNLNSSTITKKTKQKTKTLHREKTLLEAHLSSNPSWESSLPTHSHVRL